MIQASRRRCWRPIGICWKTATTTARLYEYATCVIIPPVNIHPSAVIEESVIGPYVTIGSDCKITHSIIRNSIIDAEALIEDTTMDQSLVGKEAIVRGRYRQFNVGDSALVGYSNHEDE